MFANMNIPPQKFKDPELSLLDEQWRIFKRRSLLMIIFLALLPGYGWIVLIPVCINHKNRKNAYLEAKELRDEKQEDLLLKDVKYSFGATFKEAFRLEAKIYALVDLKSKEIGKIIFERLNGSPLLNAKYMRISPQNLSIALDVLAMKLGYKHRGDLIEKYEIKLPSKSSSIEYSLPITKVFYIDEFPSKTKCMISSLRLDIEKDTIVICPNCRNMAKRELLAEWLEESGSCPVCRRKIVIDDCPVVKIQ
ncbi:MAG TPA: hypothetical protein VMZ29_10385 [Candidatus Bathyarchaeia archaeon]|nr:hypothetical protein [Candidatus Bathyarchaeia archaeon]